MRRGLSCFSGNSGASCAIPASVAGPRRQRWLARLLRPPLTLCLLILSASSAWAQAPIPAHGLNPNFGTYPIGEVGIQLVATGGTGTYAWQVIGGALPPGVSLRTDTNVWPSWVAGNTSGMLLGIATTPGQYNFTLRVTSGGISVDQNATIRVSNLSVGNVWDLPRGYLGKPYAEQLIPLNATGPVTWTFGNAGGKPPGISLSSTGIINGTPTQSGYYSFDVLMTSGGQTIFRWINLEIHAVEITSPAELPAVTTNQSYGYTLTGSGGTAPYTFSVSLNSLPAGLVLNPNGTISGTSSAGRGVSVFRVTMTDANQRSTWKNLSINTLFPPQQAPRLFPWNEWNDCTFGVVCERTVTASSGGTMPFTWTISGQPPGMDIAFRDYLNPNSILVGGTPTAVGTFNVTVTVTDAVGLSTTNVFPLRVSPLYQRFDSFRQVDLIDFGLLDGPYTSKLSLFGGVLPYAAAVMSPLPPGLTFDPATFVVSGTPTAAGSFTVDFEYSDAIGQKLRVRDFLSIDGSQRSTSNGGTISVGSFYLLGTATPGSFFSRTLTACCAPSLVWTAVDPLPPGLTLSPSGVLSGTPTTTGDYRFLIRAADGQFPGSNWAQQRFFLTVATPSPLLGTTQSSLLPFGNVGTPYGFSLTATGSSGPFTWTLAPQNYLPPGLSLASDGTISGTPTHAGQFGFQVNVTDGSINGTRFLTLFIYLPGQNAPLDISFGPNLGSFNLGQLQFQLTATGGTPPYQYTLTPGANAVPGMRIQSGQPLPLGFTGTGAFLGVLLTPGSFSSSLRVTDAAGATLDRPFTMSVSGLQILSQNTLPRATVGDPYSFTLEPFGASNYGWSATNLPPGITVNASGQLQGTPTASGNFNAVITLTDLATGVARGFSHTIGVDPFAITTNGELPVGTVGVPYSQILTAPGCVSCVWSIVSGGLPAGLLLSGDVISGTPTSSAFSFGFTVRASGSNATVQKLFSIQVNTSAPLPLSIVTSSFGDRTPTGAVANSVLAQGGAPPYIWTLESGALPTGIALVNSGDTLGANLFPGVAYLAGRPVQAGVSVFTLRVTDSLGATTTRSFTWNISALNFGYFTLPLTTNTLRYSSPYMQPLLGIGGTGNYTWTNLGPMPPGLTLDPTGLVSGRPTNTGSFSTQIQLTDDGGNSFTGSVTFNIVSPTGTTLNFGLGANLGTFSRGSSFSSDLGISGGTGPYTVTAQTALPPGFTLLSGNSLTGSSSSGWFLAGTAVTTGTYTFTLEAVDSLGNVGARTFSISVTPISIVSSALANAAVGVAYLQPLLAAGGNGAVTWSLATGSVMPPGLAISPGGAISGIPTQTGSFSFQILATDSTSNVASRTFFLTVAGLAITDSNILPTSTAGVPYSHTFSAVGGVATPVWSTPGTLPAGLTLSPSGVLSGTGSQSVGSFTFTVSVTDGVTSFSRVFTMYFSTPIPSVLSVGPPVTSLTELVVGQATFVTLPTPSGGAPPYTWSVAPGSSLPPGLAVVAGSQMVPTSIPGLTFLLGAPTTAGSYVFDLVATDQAGTRMVRTYTVNVSNISILAGFRTPVSGVAYSQQLTAVGGTPPYTYTATPTSATIPMLPPGISLSASGLLSGTTTSTGQYTVRVRVVDGAGNSFARTLNFVISNPTGLRVTTLTTNLDVNLGGGRTVLLTATGPGSTGATWSLVSGALPPGMGIFPNVPGVGFVSAGGVSTVAGTYTFTVRATDSANPSNFADREFTVRVVPMQIVSPPVETGFAQLPAAQVGQVYTTTIKMAGGTPPYAFTPTPFSPLPAGLSLSTSGILSGTPQQIGAYVIGFDVADSAGNTFTSQQLSLTVTPAGVPRPLAVPIGVANFGQASVGIDFANSFRGALDFIVRGGVLPFSWSLSPGSSLPPGMTILPGGNGVSDVLGGSPTTPGVYSFSLDIADAAGQTFTIPSTLTVSNLTLGPQLLPHGRVGSPYSITLSNSGGTPPYGTIRLNNPFSDLPPGFALSSGGVLSGTPTMAGNFLIQVLANDTSSTVNRIYRVTINNAAGQAPPVSITPTLVHVHHVQGSAVSPTALNVNTSSGVPFTAVVSGIPGASLQSTAGTTPTNIALNLGLASLSPGTYHGFVGVAAPTAANLYDIVPITVDVVAPPPCTYTVNPTAGSVPSGFGGASFSVATGPTCTWTATPSASWIQILAGSSGTGPGTVSFLTTANPVPAQRTGSITVNGAVYSITQFGTSCSFAINPAVINAPLGGGSAVIAVTASNPACAWTASGLNVTPAGGTGNGSVTVTIPANGTPGTVPVNATIAGQTFTANVAGVGCSVSLGSTVVSMPDVGGQSTVQVTAPSGCSYSTVTGPSWITVSSGGSGNGTGSPAPLIFNVAANSSTLARSGSLTISGQTFQVDQAGLPCSVTVDTSGLGSPYGPAGGVGLVGVTTNGSNCTWNASSGASFATVSPQSGIGNGSVAVTVLSNAGSTTERSTNLTIAGQPVLIRQSGTACTFNLQSAAGTVPAAGGSGSVGVVAPAVCTWGAVSNNLPWLSITSSGNAGSTNVQFVAQANTSANPRVGTLTVAGHPYTVTQAGAPCTYTLSASSLNVASSGTSSSFSFNTAATGCSPAAVSFSSWIKGVNTTFNGSAGTVDFTVDPTPFTTNRIGTVQLGDKTFTITQLGGSCGFSLASYGALFGTAGGNGSVFGSPTALGCVPATGTTQPTIISLSPLGPSVNNIFTQDYSVVPFSSLTPAVRRAQITFGGLVFTVKQSSY